MASVLFFAYTAWQNSLRLAFATLGLSGGMAVASVTALVLARRGRLYPAGLVLFGGLAVSAPLLSALIADIGLPVAMILSPAAVIILEIILPRRHLKWGVAVAIVSVVVTLTINLFWPWQQLSVSRIQTFVWGMGIVLTVAQLYLLFRQFPYYSLQAKMVIASITVVLVSLALLSQMYRITTRRAFIQLADKSLLEAAGRVALNLDSFINDTKRVLQSQATIPDFVDYMQMSPDQRAGSILEEEVQTLLQIFKHQAGTYILAYGLVDPQGKVVLDASPSLVGNNEGGRDYIQQPLATGQTYVSPVEFSAQTGGASWYFTVPIRNESGEIVGVLRVEYAPTLLQQMVRRFNALAGPESFPILFDENHMYLAQGAISETPLYTLLAPIHDPNRLVTLRTARRLPFLPGGQTSLNQTELAARLENAQTEATFTLEGFPTAGQTQQVAVANLTALPWQVAFFQPRDVFLAGIKVQERVTLLVSTLLTGIAVAMATGAAQYLIRPIARLTATARRVAEGDLSAQAPVETRDEIGQLGETFNNMTARLRQLIGSLEEQVQERTQELTYSIEVGQRAASIRDLNVLLPAITEMIRERFNLYYVQVYFVDDLRQNLVLKAGTGSAGKALLARGFSLPIGPGSIGGQVAATGKTIVVSDTTTSPLYKPIDLLPDTR
ncbi:MAG: HAMP domain-containing protein, partial [Caldilineae bacterium]